MRGIPLAWLVTTVAVAIAAGVLTGIDVGGPFWGHILAGAVVCAVNAPAKPAAQILVLPVTILTLGLFWLVVNGLMLLLADAALDELTVDGIWWAILGAIVISIVSARPWSAVGDDEGGIDGRR